MSRARRGRGVSATALAIAILFAFAGPAGAQQQEPARQGTLPLPPRADGLQALSPVADAIHSLPIRAQLRSYRHTTLAAGIPARIDSLSVLEGERVAEGETLIEFDCSSERAARRAAAARAEAARASMRADAELVRRGSAGKVKADLSRAEHAAAQAELQGLDTVLEKCAITAPYGGVVTRKAAQQHQFVNAGEALLELVDTDAIEVDMVVPSRWLAWLKPGHPFALQLDETGDALQGEVDRYGGTVDPVSQTVRLLGRLHNRPGLLLPGMSGLLQFQAPHESPETAGEAAQ